MTGGIASASAYVQINGGAEYTNTTQVSVAYSPNGWEDYYSISNSLNMYNAAWSPIPSVRTVAWVLPYTQGPRTVYMEFTYEPDKYDPGSVWGVSAGSDTIILDTQSPTCKVSSYTVRRYATARLVTSCYDYASQKVSLTLKIKTLGGAVKKTLQSGWVYDGTYRWTYSRVSLRKGTYRVEMTGVDQAGNASGVGRASLYVR